jgi:sporulation protein YlmC with PRC-barrel domain
MNLARDIIDKQVVDKNQAKMGKVDGVVLALHGGKPPVVSYIEIGGITLARRVGRRTERFIRLLKKRWGSPRAQQPYRVAWRQVWDIGVDIEVALDVRETPVNDWQNWLRDKVIRRIPGS